MIELAFVHPARLWLALVVPVAIAVLYVYDRRQRARMLHRLGDLPVIGRAMTSASPRRRAVKDLLAALALAMAVVALTQPQLAGNHEVEVRGLDIAVAIDVSKSMLVDDVGPTSAMTAHHIAPSRLARARELAAAVIDALPGDRFAPIAFAGAAAHFPLTEDREVATRFLSDLGPNELPPGSNVPEVFRVTRCLLRPDLYADLGCARIGRRGHGGDPLQPGESLDPKPAAHDHDTVDDHAERGKAIVIITDGGDADDEAVREVMTARELGIAVFIVGEGTPRGGIVHEVDGDGHVLATPKRTRDGQPVLSTRDDAAMRAIVAAAGDARRYFIAADQGEVDAGPLVRALRAIENGVVVTKRHERRDVFEPFLFAAFMLLVIGAAIGTRRRENTT